MLAAYGWYAAAGACPLQCCGPTRVLGKCDGAGIELKFVEPPEARKPNRKWRLYIFKAGEKDAIKGTCVEEHCGTAALHCAKANGGGIAQRSRMCTLSKHRLGSPSLS